MYGNNYERYIVDYDFVTIFNDRLEVNRNKVQLFSGNAFQ